MLTCIMRKVLMKSIFFTIFTMLLLFTAKPSHALQISIGASFLGGGFNMNRGDDYKKFLNSFNPTDEFKKKSTFSFSPAFQANLMFNFSPYFAIETGIGVGVSRSFHAESSIKKDEITITRIDMIIPLMLRLQYSSQNIILYTSIGPNFNMPTTEYPYTQESNKAEAIESFKSVFTIDMSFAFGAEYMVSKNHYIGVRADYNLNVMPMFSIINNTTSTNKTFEALNWNQDRFNLSLTYRYAFDPLI